MYLFRKKSPGGLQATVKGIVGGRGGPYKALPFLAMPRQGVPGPGLSCTKSKKQLTSLQKHCRAQVCAKSLHLPYT